MPRIEPTYYLKAIMNRDRRKKYVEAIISRLKRMREQYPFDAIVVRGLSGALIISEVSNALDIPFIVVRKGESTHGHRGIEIPQEITDDYVAFGYVVLDDFVASGETLGHIWKAMRSYLPGSKFVGFFGWESNFFLPKHEFTLNRYDSPLYRREHDLLRGEVSDEEDSGSDAEYCPYGADTWSVN